MPRIAIIGSCITRDLWPIQGGGAEHLLYISRTSLPSLFSIPVKDFRPPAERPGDLHRAQHNALVADLEKTALARLVAYRPTHIIFDFIDERFDLLSIGDALITHSGELQTSGYLSQGALRTARSIPRLSDACERLWMSGLRELAGLIAATPLREAQLILHSARWATVARGAGGALTPLRDVSVLGEHPADIAAHNALLARYDAAFETEVGAHSRIAAPDFQIADTGHRWGLSPFHYVPEYYDTIRGHLEMLGLALFEA